MAALQLDVAYIKNQDELGLSYPAEGFSSVILSNNFSITEPTGMNNVRIVHVEVPLDGSLIHKKDWCDIVIQRISPFDDMPEYDSPIYLSAISFRYKKM
jgi:hypothetical protein